MARQVAVVLYVVAMGRVSKTPQSTLIRFGKLFPAVGPATPVDLKSRL